MRAVSAFPPVLIPSHPRTYFIGREAEAAAHTHLDSHRVEMPRSHWMLDRDSPCPKAPFCSSGQMLTDQLPSAGFLARASEDGKGQAPGGGRSSHQCDSALSPVEEQLFMPGAGKAVLR